MRNLALLNGIWSAKETIKIVDTIISLMPPSLSVEKQEKLDAVLAKKGG